ncbi:xanthine dehydrogenase YagS FAD-binding subunit [Lentzea albidocapillata subsp. violacea]|uniref:Xanthine dehydrogenase YagS FAD-binding subunit n=1 Tax=Lentzea albidocapillata subsp. violacea TaxID=128104 RepID=A0A1G8V9W1_9PSEU|nr:xanthine dehydrogenase family protein subunit M [Lentzea albidocapillata]SDJ62906.1 xanthine dehydrogenase YagS FAD-binding subunit [Lentzea albidocapillata subsp. violacea]
MRSFGYASARDSADAVRLADRTPGAAFIAGGTDLLNLMKDGVQHHRHLVDVNKLDLARVTESASGLRIGGLARMRQVAEHHAVRARFPVLAEALLASASPQVRNMATIGGNLLQRTRCGYFRDIGSACNKRVPGSGCSALQGWNRGHAVLGGSESCIATHPSDLAVALTALDASVHVLGPGGTRRIPVGEFYRLPGDTPQIETSLRPAELITAVEVPRHPTATRSRYLKLRDRATFEFAVVSVAAALDLRGHFVRDIRLAFGGIGTKPWRSAEAEAELRGKNLTVERVEQAGRVLVRGAVPRQDNEFKVELVQRALAELVLGLGGLR